MIFRQRDELITRQSLRVEASAVFIFIPILQQLFIRQHMGKALVTLPDVVSKLMSATMVNQTIVLVKCQSFSARSSGINTHCRRVMRR